MVLEYVLQNRGAITDLHTHPDELLPDLDFADDIVLLNHKEMEALERFRIIESSGKNVGLSIDYDQTKIMIRNIENTRTEVIEGQTI